MTIVKEEYHPNGVVSYQETASGHKEWFNEAGKIVKSGFNDRIDCIYEYDAKGRIVAWHYTDASTIRREYSEKGNSFREWDEDGSYEGLFEYDEDGNLIHFRDRDNPSAERYHQYENGKCIRTWDAEGNIIE